MDNRIRNWINYVQTKKDFIFNKYSYDDKINLENGVLDFSNVMKFNIENLTDRLMNIIKKRDSAKYVKNQNYQILSTWQNANI